MGVLSDHFVNVNRSGIFTAESSESGKRYVDFISNTTTFHHHTGRRQLHDLSFYIVDHVSILIIMFLLITEVLAKAYIRRVKISLAARIRGNERFKTTSVLQCHIAETPVCSSECQVTRFFAFELDLFEECSFLVHHSYRAFVVSAEVDV